MDSSRAILGETLPKYNAMHRRITLSLHRYIWLWGVVERWTYDASRNSSSDSSSICPFIRRPRELCNANFTRSSRERISTSAKQLRHDSADSIQRFEPTIRHFIYKFSNFRNSRYSPGASRNFYLGEKNPRIKGGATDISIICVILFQVK